MMDIKKSVNLLHAYGEYNRFISISKKFMKDKGIFMGQKQIIGTLGLNNGAKKRKRRARTVNGLGMYASDTRIKPLAI